MNGNTCALRRISRMAGLLAVAAIFGAAGTASADAIDDYVNAEMQRQRIPGLALAIVRHGEPVRLQGYGFANLEHRVPVIPETVFQTGSVGKQFTAVAAMLLVEDGKLRLDEPIRSYLPAAPQSWSRITLRHLLNHTSGLAGEPGFDLRRDYTDDELLQILYGVEVEFPAGQRFSYSNTGYVLIGLLIRQVGGVFYGDVLKDRVFKPLGMTTARIIDDRGIVSHRAAGYEVDDTSIRNQDWVAPTGNSTGDGSLYMTLGDYVQWEAAIRSRKILSQGSWDEIAKPVRLSSGRAYPYGFGWGFSNFAGQELWQHSGGWQGFSTFYVRYLEDGLAIIVLANSDSANPTSIAYRVAGLYDPRLALPQATPIEDREPEVTRRLRRLLEATMAGKVEPGEFEYLSEQEVTELAAADQELIQPLGPPGEIGLFARKDVGNDRVHRYRVRFEEKVLDATLALAPSGKISSFSLDEVESWNTPLIPRE
jgi:CubicO group peptidase (beta-lactamase class C family)